MAPSPALAQSGDHEKNRPSGRFVIVFAPRPGARPQRATVQRNRDCGTVRSSDGKLARYWDSVFSSA